MGSEVGRALAAADDLELAAGVDDGDALDGLAGCAVVVDFTHPGVVLDNLHWCIGRGLDVVVGTSGFDEARLAQVRDWLAGAPSVRVLIAANFSVGAVLMMSFAPRPPGSSSRPRSSNCTTRARWTPRPGPRPGPRR